MGMIARIVIISGLVIRNLLPISLQAQTKAYLESAWADVSAKKIIVSTGLTKRTSLITDYGMTTLSLYDEKNNKEWASTKTTSKCDWDLPGLINDSTKADLVKQSVKESTDDGFTSNHLEESQSPSGIFIKRVTRKGKSGVELWPFKICSKCKN
jgi:hypothetical protein